MSYVEIVFNIDNAAFSESEAAFEGEMKNILSQIEQAVEDAMPFARLRDSNGNRVGFYAIQEEA